VEFGPSRNGQEALDETFVVQFQAEHANWVPGAQRGVQGDAQHETGLPCRWGCRDHDHIGGLQPIGERIQVDKAGRDACQFVTAGTQLAQFLRTFHQELTQRRSECHGIPLHLREDLRGLFRRQSSHLVLPGPVAEYALPQTGDGAVQQRASGWMQRARSSPVPR
jgi:hypothetical protein